MVIGEINRNCTVLFHVKQITSSLHPYRLVAIISTPKQISPEKNEEQRK